MVGLFLQMKFRNLLLGRVFSVFGDSLIYISLLKWIEIQSGSTGATTLFFIAFYLPAALFAIPIGAWIEGKVLQRIMIMSDLIRGVTLLIFIGTISFIPYQWAYAFLFIDSVMSLFFIPANQSLLPYIVKEKHRSSANGLLQASFVGMRMAGHAIASILISLGVNILLVLIISATMILLSLFLINRIKPNIKPDIGEKRSQWQMILKGLIYVWKSPGIRGVFTLFIIAWFVGSSIELIFVVYLVEVLGLGVEDISFFTVTQFIGMVLGAGLSPKFYGRFNQKWLFIGPVFAFAIALLSLNIIGGLIWVLPFFLIAGFSFGTFNMALPTFIQDIADKRFYSRIFSLHTMIFNFMPLPGLLFFGMVIEKLDIERSIIIVSSLLLVVGFASIIFMPKMEVKYKQKKLQTEAT